MWSEGGWAAPDYRVKRAYAIADSPLGPFERIGTTATGYTVATSAGHIILYARCRAPTNGTLYITGVRWAKQIAITAWYVWVYVKFDTEGKIIPVKTEFGKRGKGQET